jgi:hypothetical protein
MIFNMTACRHKETLKFRIPAIIRLPFLISSHAKTVDPKIFGYSGKLVGKNIADL